MKHTHIYLCKREVKLQGNTDTEFQHGIVTVELI